MKYVLRKSGRVRPRWCWGGSTLEPGGPLKLRQASALQWDNSSGWAHLYSLIIGGLKTTNKQKWKGQTGQKRLTESSKCSHSLSDPKSYHWLVLSVTFSCCWDLVDITLACEDAEFTQLLLANVELNCWICQSCYMDLLNLLHVFLALLPNKSKQKIDQISRSVELNCWICQSCYMDFF